MQEFLPILSSLWNEDASYVWWQAFLFATLFLLGDGLFCGITWFIRKETIIECGYRKGRIKRTKKAMKEWPLFDKILLRRLAAEATESNPMVGLSLFLNYGNIAFALIAVFGYLCAILTCGSGWAMALVCYPGVTSMMLSTVITFIPDLLWVPSERRRYGIKDKKK